MAKMEDFFDSKYLKAEDLRGHEASVVIAGISSVTMNDNQKKAALFFEGKKKMLLLNKTNASRIASVYGQDMDNWIGKEIVLYPDQTQFQGSMVDCLRVRVVKQREPGDDAPLPF